MVTSDKSQKPGFLAVFWGRLMLKIWLPFILLELVLLLFGGLAYCLLLFWLFHLVLTSTRLVPRIAKILLGAKLYKTNSEKFLKQGLSKWYMAYWLISNIAFLVIAVISFKYNVRLVDMFFM